MFRIGDIVKIREDLSVESKYNGIYVNSDMVKLAGRIMKIRLAGNQIAEFYYLSDDKNDWTWTKEMLEELPKGYKYKEPKFLCKK